MEDIIGVPLPVSVVPDDYKSQARRINPAWRTALGGFMVHMVLGTVYLWGNITPIVTSYLRKFDSSLTYTDTIFVYITALMFNGISMLCSGYVEKLVGTRACVLIGGYMVAVAALLASYASSLHFLLLTQGILFGTGFGIAYAAPFSCAVRWLPQRKGLLTGIVIAGIGVGAAFFSVVANRYANPLGVSAAAAAGSGGIYYPPDHAIPLSVPGMYRTLSALYFILVSIGALLVYPYSEIEYFKFTSGGDVHMEGDAVDLLPDSCSNESVLDSRSLSRNGSLVASIQRTACNIESAVKDIEVASIEGERSFTDGVFCDTKGATLMKRIPSVTTVLDSSMDKHFARIGVDGSSEGGVEGSTGIHSPLPTPSFLGTGGEGSVVVPSSEDERDISPRDLLFHTSSWHVVTCFFLTTLGGMYIAGTFRTFGVMHFSNDSFLSMVGSVASLCNTVGRVVWGSLGDRCGCVVVLIGMNLLYALIFCTYPASVTLGENGYAMWTYLIFFIEGGNFALYPSLVMQMFGSKHGGGNYGVLFALFNTSTTLSIAAISKLHISIAHASEGLGILTFIGTIGLLVLPKMHKKT